VIAPPSDGAIVNHPEPGQYNGSYRQENVGHAGSVSSNVIGVSPHGAVSGYAALSEELLVSEPALEASDAICVGLPIDAGDPSSDAGEVATAAPQPNAIMSVRRRSLLLREWAPGDVALGIADSP
jgi:hypothetical protein